MAHNEEIGCRNLIADDMLRTAKEETWSDTNLDDTKFREFTRLVCTCGHDEFQVVITAAYHTSARCTKCLKWYIVHTG